MDSKFQNNLQRYREGVSRWASRNFPEHLSVIQGDRRIGVLLMSLCMVPVNQIVTLMIISNN